MAFFIRATTVCLAIVSASYAWAGVSLKIGQMVTFKSAPDAITIERLKMDAYNLEILFSSESQDPNTCFMVSVNSNLTLGMICPFRKNDIGVVRTYRSSNPSRPRVFWWWEFDVENFSLNVVQVSGGPSTLESAKVRYAGSTMFPYKKDLTLEENKSFRRDDLPLELRGLLVDFHKQVGFDSMSASFSKTIPLQYVGTQPHRWPQ